MAALISHRAKHSRPGSVVRRLTGAFAGRGRFGAQARVRALPAVLLLFTATALGYVAWFWHDQSRPGMRHFYRGMEYLNARYPARAEQEWLLGVKQDPAEYRCYEQLGDYYSELRQPEQAAVYYAAAARRAPRIGSLFLRLAAAQQRSGQRDRARDSARRAAALLPDNADAVGLYGLLLAESRNRPAALATLRRAHRLRPNDRRYFIPMVSTEMDTFDFTGVERDLTPYLRAHPHDAEACYMMAVVYNQKPRTPLNLRTALEFAQRAVTGMPGDERGYNLLGQLYLDADRVAAALAVYKAGRRIAPNSEGMLRGLETCNTLLGMNKEAAAIAAQFRQVLARHDRIAHLTHVMGFNHHDTTAGLELARLVEEDNRPAQARVFYEQLVHQAPHDPRTRRALAGFYRRIGQPERARQALQPQFVP